MNDEGNRDGRRRDRSEKRGRKSYEIKIHQKCGIVMRDATGYSTVCGM